MNLVWYVNRLRSMSPLEVIHRLSEKAKKITAKGRMEGWQRYRNEGQSPITPGLPTSVDNLPEAERANIIEQAEGILNGQVFALGQVWPKSCLDPGTIDKMWSYDPTTGKQWPGAQDYTFSTNYRHRRDLGDVKFVWEFNRLQFLQPLAMAFALTSEHRFADAISRTIESWYKLNPPFRGIAWNSGIELALRTISLLLVSNLAGKGLPSDIAAKLRTILHAHAVWMARYPSGFSSANNHLVAEATAQFLLGTASPEIPIVGRQSEKYQRILEREARLQILADGAPAEQSPTYGAFTAELLFLAAMVGKSAGAPFSEGTHERLDRFANFVFTISDADGNVPSFGDDDEGRVLTDMSHEPDYALNIANSILAVRGKAISSQPTAQLVFRDTILGLPIRTANHDSKSLTTFMDGGLTVMNGKTVDGRPYDLTFDHGPLGYLTIAAHGHADALSITLSISGRPIFVDPGTYLYHSGGKWRDWFRGTRAHNTVCINGCDQSVISGPFNWVSKASCRLVSKNLDQVQWAVTAQHDGYAKTFGITHRRTISGNKSEINIEDEFIGDSPRSVEISFQLGSDLTAEKCETAAVEISHAGNKILKIKFPELGQISMQTGVEKFDGGWVSSSFGHKKPATRISWFNTDSSESVTTTLQFIDS